MFLYLIYYRLDIRTFKAQYMSKTNKKGFENISSFITAVGAAIVFVVLLVITLKFTYFSEEVKCKATDFQFGELQDKISLMLSAGSGDREEKEFTVPCGDRAYFFNLNKKQELLSSGSLRDEPLLEDAVSSATSSETDNNLYIMKKNKIVGSFSLGDIRLDYPYNLCFDLKARRKVRLALDDLGAKVMIRPNCEEVECTVVPEKLEQPEIETLLNDICKGETGTALDECKNAERQNIENAKGNLDIKLKVSTCFPETTKVEFIIKPKEKGTTATDVKLFETVPKDCIDDLNKYVEKLEGGETEIILKSDPMIVWSFSSLNKEERVAYQITKFLDDHCRKQLRAVVAAKTIQKTGFVTPASLQMDHSPRFEPDETKRATQNPTYQFPLDLVKLPNSLKGKKIVIEADTPRELGRTEEHPGREEEEEGGVVDNTPPVVNTNFINTQRRVRQSSRLRPFLLCPTYINDVETPCDKLDYNIEYVKPEDSKKLKCYVQNSQLSC